MQSLYLVINYLSTILLYYTLYYSISLGTISLYPRSIILLSSFALLLYSTLSSRVLLISRLGSVYYPTASAY